MFTTRCSEAYETSTKNDSWASLLKRNNRQGLKFKNYKYNFIERDDELKFNNDYWNDKRLYLSDTSE